MKKQSEGPNNVQIFKNSVLGLGVRMILNPDGSISVNAEDTAIGFGWSRTEIKNGKEYRSIMWKRMNGFLKEMGFAHECAKNDYIPESLFYRLGMKANNSVADKFQNWLAMEVIPSIRKNGFYSMPQTNGEKIKLIAQGYEELDNRVTEIDDRIKTLEDRLNVVGAFDNEKYLNQIRGATHSRVAILTKDPTNKVLWTHYFYIAIYGLLKKIYEVSTIKSIPVSATESAIGLIEHWVPSDPYLENRINKMKSEMEENLLPDKKTIAFLQYMRNTHDGKINPFRHL